MAVTFWRIPIVAPRLAESASAAYRLTAGTLTYRRTTFALRPLGHLGAGGQARRLRQVHVAKLQAVRRQDRTHRISVVVDQQNGVVARDHGDELVVAARRGKGAGKSAPVLLVDRHGESDAVEAWFGRWRRGMMGIPGADDDRLALAFPGAAHVGDRALRRRRRGGKGGEYDNPGKLRHGRGPPGVHRLSTFGKGPIPRSTR